MLGEHDNEPIHGLPGLLPKGEKVLWQGRPAWWPMARRALCVVPVLVYFLAIAIWRFAEGPLYGTPIQEAAASALWLVPVAALSVAILCGIAWAFARSTVYTITNHRVVIRFGVAMPMAVNLPFAEIGAANVKHHSDGSGDVVLQMTGKGRIAYIHLWPNVRPWHFSPPQPALRAIPDPARVAETLGHALSAFHDTPCPVAATAPERKPQGATAPGIAAVPAE